MNYTQEQIAEKMDVSIQMVSNLERGIKAIKIENLIKISEILKISTDYILTGKHTSTDTDIILNRIAQLADEDYKMVDMIIEYCLNKK
ncbi:MAG: helix-turn-helix transcriptional regulator [Clostridia bacterium]|nr:helix-turn-helix transcriptional regulator [Clostridia bacterium]